MTSSAIHSKPKSPKVSRPPRTPQSITEPATCAICGLKPAKVILADSNLPCCNARAYRCRPTALPGTICYRCDAPAVKVTRYGPICGSNECPGFLQERQKRFEATMLERYGCTAALHSPELTAKIRQTTKERYGFEHASQSPGIFAKARERCREEHGVDHWTQRPEVKEARRDTNLERYGTENPIQNPEVVETRRQNNLVKYGVIHPQQVKGIALRKYRTWVRNQRGLTFGSLEWSQEWRDRFQEEFGVDHPSKLPETSAKWHSTLLKNLGVDIPMKSPEVRQKQQATMLERHGVANASHSPEMRDKARETSMERFGVPYAIQNPEIFKRALSRMYRTKHHTLPSGRVVQYQGYELPSIQHYLSLYDESDMIFNSGLSVPYEYNGQVKVYYPDLAIIPTRQIIEVKSTYTFRIALGTTLIPKFRAARQAGWEPLCEIWNHRGQMVIRMTLEDIQAVLSEILDETI